MFRMLTFILSLSMCASLQATELLNYTGTLESVARNGSTIPLKEFEVKLYLGHNNDTNGFFTLSESNDSLPWAEQFGPLNSSSKLLSSEAVAIGYRHLDRNYVIPVGLPFFPERERLQANSDWKDGTSEFRVAGDETINGIDCWRVKATIGIARHHEFFVSKNDSIIQAGTQTVFMGPGDRFRLNFQRTGIQKLSATNETVENVIPLLHELQIKLDRVDHDRFRAMSIDEIEVAALAMPQLLEKSAGTTLHEYILNINKSVQLQKSRNQRVQGLANSMIGQKLPQFNLQRLSGEEVPSSSLRGKSVVLHFWDYTNQTLEQPYGQIGYLDFINNRWEGKNVQIYGVAINSKLQDPEQKQQAIRDIKKLKQFMKLGYEIMSDPGSALNSFGNPTRLGQELPLWIVLSPQGEIVHYQTGFFPVDPKVGLKEIDSLLQKYVSE